MFGQKIRTLWKPEVFHGFGKTRGYFEGWYFKSLSADEKTACAVIPGISLTNDPETSHAFVQFVEASQRRAYYFRYPLSDFWASRKAFEIKIGPNSFSFRNVHLELSNGDAAIRGELKFESIHAWPVRLFSPGVMGWYAFVPSMECYHGVLSFDHDIEGILEINGKANDFTGGKGYIEKDWGVSMPSSWIWIQTNHFDGDRASLFGSVAKIPWRGSYFTGTIFGFFYKGKVFRFTTYTGAKVRRLHVDAHKIEIAIEDKKRGLEISADRQEGVDIPAPKLGDMTAKVKETLKSEIRVSFYQKNRGARETLFSGTGRNAGLEFVGDIDELLRGFKK
jgi:tocopherol cyclase